MKRLSLLVILLIALLYSCSPLQEDDHIPEIISISLYNSAGTITDNFKINDTILASIAIFDPDLDIESLLITSYHPSDSDTPYDGPLIYHLTEQTDEQVVYQVGFIAIGPAGEWRIEFQVEDSEGNESEIFPMTITKDE